MPVPTPFVALRLLLVGLHLLFATLQVALLFPLCAAPWRQRLTRRWSRQLLALLGIRVEFAGDLACGEGGLLVGNHISFIDIYVINALLPSAFVAKNEVAHWPLIGWLCRHTGTIFIERGSRKAAHRTQQQLLAELCAGRRLAIFPEGTSTAGDKLLPFHAALFQSAIDASVPVHALALSYHSATGGRSAAPAYTGDISLLDCLLNVMRAGPLSARLTLAASFAPPLADRRHLAHHARQTIVSALALSAGCAPAPLPVRNPDRGNRAGNPSQAAAQSLCNEAAIMR